MARPQKEGLDYFPHDVYASSDEKIEPLILLYGAKGYAFFFLHLEYIYRNSALEFDISDAETRQVICQKLQISTEEYEQILATALKKGCFDKSLYESANKLTSNGIKKRASTVLDKRERMRQQYEKEKKESNTKKEDILNKSKVKEKNCCVSSLVSDTETENKSMSQSVDDFFDSVWCLYPKKEGKAHVSKTQREKLFKIGYDTIACCVERYKKAKTSTDAKYIQMGSTFFNSGYVDYLDENFNQNQKAQQPNQLQLKVIDYL